MMASSNINIKFEIEPIVKLQCTNINCKFNMSDTFGEFYCNLKHVSLDEIGSCESQEDKI